MGDASVRPGPEPHELGDGENAAAGPWTAADDPASKRYWDRLERATDAEQVIQEGAMVEDPGSPVCPECGLTADLRITVSRGWVLLEPQDVTEQLPTHFAPPRHRWYLQADGVASNTWHADPVPGGVCRINHTLVCPGLVGPDWPDPWPWLTAIRGENARRARRLADTGSLPLDAGRDEPA